MLKFLSGGRMQSIEQFDGGVEFGSREFGQLRQPQSVQVSHADGKSGGSGSFSSGGWLARVQGHTACRRQLDANGLHPRGIFAADPLQDRGIVARGQTIIQWLPAGACERPLSSG